MITGWQWSQARRENRDDTIRSRWKYFPRFVKLLWELGRREILIVSVVSLVGGLVPLLIVVSLRRVVDSGVAVITAEGAVGDAVFWLGVLLIANVLEASFGLVNAWVSAQAQERLDARAQERLLVKASRVPLSSIEHNVYFDRLHRAQWGMENSVLRAMQGIFALPSSFVTALSLLIYLGSVHIMFPIVLLAGVIPGQLVGFYYFKKIYQMKYRHSKTIRFMRYIGDLLRLKPAAAEVRLFGLGEYLFRKRLKVALSMRDDILRLAKKRSSAAVAKTLWEQVTYGAVVVGVTLMILRRELSVGYFAAFIGAAERFASVSTGVVASIRTIDNTLLYVKDYVDYLELEEEPASTYEVPLRESKASSVTPSRMMDTSEGAPTIRFESVSFSYPGSDRLALENVEFSIPSGSHVALVGENGAGKSTVAKLLLGLYRPGNGIITTDGVDLADVPSAEWRARCSAVLQDFVRYELTAKENIGFGDTKRLEDSVAIQSAASKTGADEVIERLPSGYETVLGKAWDDEGQELSTGQWQKLAISRSYMRDAPVQVLDEPVAALDAKLEVEIYRQFRSISQGKSVLFISHRLGSARLADRIVFLENGKVIEAGSHDELIELNGRYANMYQSQAIWYQ